MENLYEFENIYYFTEQSDIIKKKKVESQKLWRKWSKIKQRATEFSND